MSTKLLNIIIGVSLIGIIGISSLQVFTKNYPAYKENSRQLTLPSQGQPPSTADELTACAGPYINFKEGTEWTYKLVTETTDDTSTKKKANTQTTMIKTRLTKKEATRMTFEHQVNGSLEKSTSELICRKSGIYGIPVVFFDKTTLSIIPKNITTYINQHLLLIPNRKVYRGKEWESKIDISGFKPALRFSVISEKTYVLPNNSKTNALHIASAANSGGPIDIGSLLKFEYNIGEQVGFIDGLLKASIPTKGSATFTISLIGFKPTD